MFSKDELVELQPIKSRLPAATPRTRRNSRLDSSLWSGPDTAGLAQMFVRNYDAGRTDSNHLSVPQMETDCRVG